MYEVIVKRVAEEVFIMTEETLSNGLFATLGSWKFYAKLVLRIRSSAWFADVFMPGVYTNSTMPVLRTAAVALFCI